MATFSRTSLTKGTSPRVPFQKVADKVLGKQGEVSLVFVSPKKAAALNRTHRKKAYTPNVLTFPYGKARGEIFICLPVAKKQAPEFGLSYTNMVLLLFIHGLLHLKGVRHGSTMEKSERRLLQTFGG